MNGEIGGFGFTALARATSTFPAGFAIEQFADDADPFDVPEVAIADVAMGLNGDLLTWSKAVPLNVSIAVIAESDDDTNLSVLLEANRVGKGKQSALDRITLAGTYPSGKIVTFSNGKLLSGSPTMSISSAGRFKSMTYKFAFQNVTVARPT
jgi:hypothetical protein